MKRTTYKVIPYGKWWEHLLRLNFYMAFRAILGWKMKSPTYSMVIDNPGLTIDLGESHELDIIGPAKESDFDGRTSTKG